MSDAPPTETPPSKTRTLVFALIAIGLVITAAVFAILASADTPCSAYMGCHTFGECTEAVQPHGEVCVASRDADCALSTGCERYGACGNLGNLCFPREPAHCEAAKVCKEHGACTYTVGLGACGECLKPIPVDAYHGFESFQVRLIGATVASGEDVACCCPAPADTPTP